MTYLGEPDYCHSWSASYSNNATMSNDDIYQAINAFTRTSLPKIILHGIYRLDNGKVKEIDQEPGHDAFFLLEIAGSGLSGTRILSNGDQYHYVGQDDYVLMREDVVPPALKRAIKKLVSKYEFEPIQIENNKIGPYGPEDNFLDQFLKVEPLNIDKWDCPAPPDLHWGTTAGDTPYITDAPTWQTQIKMIEENNINTTSMNPVKYNF